MVEITFMVEMVIMVELVMLLTRTMMMMIELAEMVRMKTDIVIYGSKGGPMIVEATVYDGYYGRDDFQPQLKKCRRDTRGGKHISSCLKKAVSGNAAISQPDISVTHAL